MIFCISLTHNTSVKSEMFQGGEPGGDVNSDDRDVDDDKDDDQDDDQDDSQLSRV